MAARSGHLRPRSLPEILDGAVRHYRARFVPLILPFLPMAVIDLIGAAAFSSFLIFVLGEWGAGPEAGAGPGAPPFDPGSIVGWFLAIGAYSVIRGAAFLLGAGSVILQTGNDLAGRTLAPRRAWMQASGRFFALVGVALLYGVAVGLGALFFVIPGVYLGVVLALSGHALLLEGTGPGEAISRSNDLMRHNFWRGMGAAVFIFAVNIALGTLSNVLQEAGNLFLDEEGQRTRAFFTLTALSFLVTTVVNVFLTPLYTVLYTHFYWDLRVRKEGLDLDTRIGRLQAETP
jgi:hypothetical protein